MRAQSFVTWRHAIVLGMSWWVGASAAWAATPSTASNASVQPLSAPDGKAGAPSFLNSASIEAGTSDTKATLTLQGYIPNFIPKVDYLHYQVSGEAPLASKGSTDEVDIGTVSGLTAGSSAHAQISAILWPKGSDNLNFAGLCAETIAKVIPGYDWGTISAANSDPQCARSFLTVENLERVVSEVNAARNACRRAAAEATNDGSERGLPDPLTQASCQRLLGVDHPAALSDQGKDPEYLRMVGADAAERFENAARDLQLFTLGVTVNRRKVSYFDASNPGAPSSTQTTGYGVDLGYSRIFTRGMVSGGFSYQKTYKNGDSLQICAPVPGSTSLECQTATLGAPQEQFARIVFVESRLLASSNVLAIAPRIEYDFTASKFAARLPVYLAPDKNKVLTGGVTFGYVSHGQGFGVTVFANKAFSFF